MSRYYKFIIALLGLAYLVSPWDILPEGIASYFGLIDDVFIISTIVYLLRYNRLPNFNFLKQFKKYKFKQEEEPFKSDQSFSNHQNNHTKEDFENHSQSDSNQSSNQEFKNNQNKNRTPYEILGVSHDAEKKEIQQAYKDAIKKYHPDKVSHLGEEFAHLANQKFLEIQKAYDDLMDKF